jgi:hypothetical protein
MSFVNATPEYVGAAATDLANIGSSINSANSFASGPTSSVAAPGADVVSAGVAELFGLHAQAYQALSEQAAAFHDQFVQLMSGGAMQYALTEAANASPLQAIGQSVLGPSSSSAQAVTGLAGTAAAPASMAAQLPTAAAASSATPAGTAASAAPGSSGSAGNGNARGTGTGQHTGSHGASTKAGGAGIGCHAVSGRAGGAKLFSGNWFAGSGVGSGEHAGSGGGGGTARGFSGNTAAEHIGSRHAPSVGAAGNPGIFDNSGSGRSGGVFAGVAELRRCVH